MLQKPTYEELKQRIKYLESLLSNMRSEEISIESELQHPRLVNLSSVLTWTSGLNKLCNNFNEAWLLFTGRSLEQELGKGWREGVHPDDSDRCENIYISAFDNQENYSMEFRLRYFSGEYRWIQENGIPHYDSKGQFAGYIGHCFDITALKQSEDKFNESLTKTKFFADIIEKTDQPIGISYPDGRLGFCNRAFCDLTGYSIEELQSMDWAKELTPPEWLSSELQALNKLQRTRKPVKYEKEYIRKNGSRVPIDMLVHIARDQAAKADYYYAFVTDITDRKTRERESLILNAAIDQAPVGIALADEDINIYYCNPNGLGIRGGAAEDLVKIPKDAFTNWQVLRPNGDPYEVENLPLVRAIKKGESVREDFIVRHQDGSDHICDATAYPIYENDTIIGGMFIFLDITDRKQAEQELIAKESKFRSYVDNAPDGVFVANEKGEYIEVNRAACKITGYTKEELLNLSIPDLLQPDDVEKGMNSFQELSQKGSTQRELRYLTKAGEERFWYIDAVKLSNTQFLGFAKDITERKQAELELIKSENRYRDLLQSANSAIIRYQSDGTITYFNEYAQTFFGYGIEEVIGKKISILLPEQESTGMDLTKLVQNIVDQPHRYINIINENICSDGRRVWMSWTNKAFMDSNGLVVEILTVGNDITDRKKAENLLIEGRAKLKGALESMTDAVCISDVDGNFVEFNEAFTTFHRLQSKKECLTALADWPSFLDVYSDDGKLLPLDMWVISRALRGEQGVQEVYKLQRRDTCETWFGSYNFAPIYDNEGSITGSVVVARDITEKRQIQAQLTQAQKMESIGNLAGGIAHDFNNILSSIIGFTELALDATPKGSAQRDDLEEVLIAGNRAKELVQQILAFARQSSEETKPVRLRDIVTEALKLLRPSTPINIDIKLTLDSTAKIIGNTSRLHQVVMNLCTNAIYSLQNSGSFLEIGLRDILLAYDSEPKVSRLPAGKYVELTVNDNGQGIDPVVIEKIFEPYFTTKKVGEGTGMGLAMVKGIIESYGGNIQVASEQGEKTSFVIRLPVATGKKLDEVGQVDPVASGTERILFVDDEPPIARMGSRMLESLGYTVTIRTSSIEALELFKEKPDDFDLVITDMTMPSMTGDVLSMELRKIRHDIPIILCTGYSNKMNEANAKLIGIEAFAYKPFTKSDLAKTIRGVLDAC